MIIFCLLFPMQSDIEQRGLYTNCSIHTGGKAFFLYACNIKKKKKSRRAFSNRFRSHRRPTVYLLETTRDEQNERSNRTGPETIERDQYRHDEITTAEVHQSGHIENGPDSHQPRGHRSNDINFNKLRNSSLKYYNNIV